MNKIKNIYKQLVLLLIINIIISKNTLIFAVGDKEEVVRYIEINCSEDLIKLSKNCVLDSYSTNLVVNLNDDIIMDNVDFKSIPIFNGIFNGNNHTIGVINMNIKGSNYGFIRYISDNAKINDLILKINISIDTNSSLNNIGLLCGENKGIIKNCTVSGNLYGNKNIGCITGINRENGVIEYCSNNAKILANKNIGGISGLNEGTIRYCNNKREINITPNESSQNVGGISGKSTGKIDYCVNYDSIGYKHTGYNVGGIVGSNSGSVTGCDNYGIINARKDVGGIVGQFEPDIHYKYENDPLKQLNNTLINLTNNLETTMQQSNKNIDVFLDNIDVINQSMGELYDVSHNAVNNGVNDAETLTDLVYNNTKSINKALDNFLGYIDVYNENISADLEKINTDITKLRKDLTKFFKNTNNNFGLLSDEIESDVALILYEKFTINKEIGNISNSIKIIEDAVRKIVEIISSEEDNLTKITLLNELFKTFNFDDINIGESLKNIKESLFNIDKHINELNKNVHSISKDQYDENNKFVNNFDKHCDELDLAIDTARKRTEIFIDNSTTEWKIINKQFNELEDTLRAYFDIQGRVIKKTNDSLNKQLNIIKEHMDIINDNANVSNDQFYKNTSSIINQLNIIRTIINDLNSKPERNIKDISNFEELEGEKGKIINCNNSGKIYGDANSGGIVGIVSPEIGIDPEKDVDLSVNKVFADTIVTLKATIRNCNNYNDIISKNECSGGIVGRAELGAVINCINNSDVTVESGDYCGGIVGNSKSMIIKSYSVGKIIGKNYVGGIAGKAKDILYNKSISMISSNGECIGGVAGKADGEICENLYVWHNFSGIDNIDYSLKATNITYEELYKLKDIPSCFKEFNVEFCADGKSVCKVKCDYDTILSSITYPDIPKKYGYYGVWEEIDKKVTSNIKINVVYKPYITVISTEEDIPTMLVEGNFLPDDVIKIKQTNELPNDIIVDKKYDYIKTYCYELSDNNKNDKYKVRLKDTLDNSITYIIYLDGKQNKLIKPKKEGSYLVFNLIDSKGKFVLIKPKFDFILIIFILSILFFIFLLTLHVLIKNKFKRMKKHII